MQVANSQWQLPQEDPRWSDQCVVIWLQQFRHGGPLCPSALPPQTQTQGMSPDSLLCLLSESTEVSGDRALKYKKQLKIVSLGPSFQNWIMTFLFHLSLPQSLSGSLHNVAEDFSSMSSLSTSLSSSSCSSSHPDLSSSSLVLSAEPSSSSSCSPQAALPVYNKQVADSCIIRVSVECVSSCNVYKSILVRTMVL